MKINNSCGKFKFFFPWEGQQFLIDNLLTDHKLDYSVFVEYIFSWSVRFCILLSLLAVTSILCFLGHAENLTTNLRFLKPPLIDCFIQKIFVSIFRRDEYGISKGESKGY